MKKYYSVRVIYEVRANDFNQAVEKLSGKTKDTQRIKTKSIEYNGSKNK